MKKNIILGALLLLALIGYLTDILALTIIPVVVLVAWISIYQSRTTPKGAAGKGKKK